MENTYENGLFCWSEIMSENKNEAENLLTKLFGYQWSQQEISSDQTYGMAQLDGKDVLGVGQMDSQVSQSGMPSNISSYIRVENVEKTFDLALGLGAKMVMPPVDVMTAGKMAIVEDPTGAVVSFWQAMEHQGSMLKNINGSIVWFELLTTDVEKAISFYSQLLGWNCNTNDIGNGQSYTECSLDSSDVPFAGIMKMPPMDSKMPSNWAPYFKVENIDESLNILKENGSIICSEPFKAGPGTVCPIVDKSIGYFNLIEYDKDM